MKDKIAEGKFGRTISHMGGGVNNPEPVYTGPIQCQECGVNAITLNTKKKSHRESGFRGTLETSWIEVHLKCPKCKKAGTYNMDHDEKDVTYGSNEEIRVFGE